MLVDVTARTSKAKWLRYAILEILYAVKRDRGHLYYFMIEFLIN